MFQTLEKRTTIDNERCNAGKRHTATERNRPAVTLCYDPQRVLVCLCHEADVRRIRRSRQGRIRRSRGFSTWGIYAA